MQDNIIIGLIISVPMHGPVALMQMHLDVSPHLRVAHLQLRALEIGTAEQIPFARMQHAHGAALRGRSARDIEITPQPDLLEKFFRE